MNNNQEIIKTLFPKVYAALHYGSKVAGYGNKTSDNDVIVVIKNYPEKIKYIYKDNYSFLAVDKKVFEDDCSKTKYGDFVAARFSGPIIPIINRYYLKKMEIVFKKKVVTIYTTQLIYERKEKALNIKINLAYFPFCKWNEQVTIYRPFRYSILNTLRSDLKDKNLKMIFPGYKKAIEELQIFDQVEKNWYQIKPEFIKKVLKNNKLFPKIEFYLAEAKKAIKRYQTHDLAGGSQTDIVIKDVIHKIDREIHWQKKGVLNKPEVYLKEQNEN